MKAVKDETPLRLVFRSTYSVVRAGVELESQRMHTIANQKTERLHCSEDEDVAEHLLVASHLKTKQPLYAVYFLHYSMIFQYLLDAGEHG